MYVYLYIFMSIYISKARHLFLSKRKPYYYKLLKVNRLIVVSLQP